MESTLQSLLSQNELAKRWGRSESMIGIASAVGVGPSHQKIDGALYYPLEEVQRYERACLFFDPAEMALQSVA